VVTFSLPAVLRERVGLQPNDAAFSYVDYEHDWDGVTETLTWLQLYRRTLNLAQQLRLCGSIGDRAVILAPQGLDYVVSFLAAVQAGLTAVPLSVPLGGASDERVSSVMRDASPAVVLTTSAVANYLTEYVKAEPGRPAPSVIEVDLLDLDAGKARPAKGDVSAETVYLQYTSGSTRTPAGVMITDTNILTNFKQINADVFSDYGGVAPPGTGIVSWLPLYHDMGLYMGIILPVVNGFQTKLTSPASFLQRPARWLQLMASSGRAFSAAPNFAYEVAARKVTDEDLAGVDLGNVVSILNGSERVQPATLQRFTERFARFNLQDKVIRPAYGMAEASVYIATRKAGHSPEIVNFESDKLSAGHAKRCASGAGTPLVSYGAARSPLVRIMDPETKAECPAGTVGEIWAHGDNIGTGYWGRPKDREDTFGATIVDPSAGTPEAPWLRTGDLGFFSEGELFIIGRIKDLLIVYGRNHSPDDIEATIHEITRGRCVAIGAPDDGIEKLVVIVELKKKGDSEEDALDMLGRVKREITSAISNAHGLGASDVLLVAPGSIPITTSGKVRRAECERLYSEGAFNRLDA
jgi:long-chain fatty acid adenylyltransferase FadD28